MHGALLRALSNVEFNGVLATLLGFTPQAQCPERCTKHVSS